ncbi:MAG: hypothetical protein BGO78_11690 [Chloroflexi bacterium 44-23]|nr:MAG: hypothetical protein BGO78_11690 [Chloroflexi bacterium 44-23]
MKTVSSSEWGRTCKRMDKNQPVRQNIGQLDCGHNEQYCYDDSFTQEWGYYNNCLLAEDSDLIQENKYVVIEIGI